MKCIKCGAELLEDSLFCSNCGEKIIDPSMPDANSEDSVETTENIKDLCPKCGNPLEPGDVFCINCGAKISQANENKETVDNPIDNKNVCPNCGSTLEPEAIFCVSCGKPLTSEAEHISQTRATTTKPNLIKQWNTKLESTNIVVKGKKFSFKIIALFGISILLMLGSYIANPIKPEVTIDLFEEKVNEMEDNKEFGGYSLIQFNSYSEDRGITEILYKTRDYTVGLSMRLSEFETELDAKEYYEELYDNYDNTKEFTPMINVSKKHEEHFKALNKSGGYKYKDLYIELIRKDTYVLLITHDEDIPKQDIKKLLNTIGMD